MRTFTLVILFTTLVGITFAQQPVPTRLPVGNTVGANVNENSAPLRNDLVSKSFVPHSYPISEKTSQVENINSFQLGNAGNLLTAYRSTANCVVADQSLNGVVFIHRNNPADHGTTGNGNSTAQYRIDVSKDGGSTFTNDIGPLNPLALTAVGTWNSRYPQVAIYNPTGNTNINLAHAVGLGPWHNGGTGLDVWDGNNFCGVRLDGDLLTQYEQYDTVNNGNSLIPNGLCNGLPGEFWACDYSYSLNTNDSLIILSHGIWNTVTNRVDWTYSMFNMQAVILNDTTRNSGLNMAFDKSGMNGWIVYLGDAVASDGIVLYEPVAFKTTDGGQNWTGPINIDLNTFQSVIDELDPNLVDYYPYAITLGLFDIVVDMNGNPHIGCRVYSGTDGGYFPTGRSSIFDVTFQNGAWEADWLDTMMTTDGIIGTSTVNGDVTQDERIQMTTTPNGDKVFVSWADSDPSITLTNTFPNLLVKGYDVNSHVWTSTINMTETDPTWQGRSTLHFGAPVGMRNSGNNGSIIPIVFSEINQSTASEDDPASFYYLNNIEVSDAAFLGVQNVPSTSSSISLFPNPNKGEFTVQINGVENGLVDVTVMNIVGQSVKSLSNQSVINGQLHLNVSDLSGGVYMLNVKNGSSNSSVTFNIAK